MEHQVDHLQHVKIEKKSYLNRIHPPHRRHCMYADRPYTGTLTLGHARPAITFDLLFRYLKFIWDTG